VLEILFRADSLYSLSTERKTGFFNLDAIVFPPPPERVESAVVDFQVLRSL